MCVVKFSACSSECLELDLVIRYSPHDKETVGMVVQDRCTVKQSIFDNC